MILVLDDYHSFAYNFVQYRGKLGVEPAVRRNDEITVAEAQDMAQFHPESVGPDVGMQLVKNFLGYAEPGASRPLH